VPVVVRAMDGRIEVNDAGRSWVVDGVEQQQLDTGGVSREHAEVDATRRRGGSQRRAVAVLEAVGHRGPRSSLTEVTMRSGSKPNFTWSAFRGAEAPKVCMPMTRPALPTYRSQPNVEACSMATRALTAGGKTLSPYSCVWWSKISQEGIETTRARMPSASSLPWASTARLSSLPEAIRITSG